MKRLILNIAAALACGLAITGTIRAQEVEQDSIAESRTSRVATLSQRQAEALFDKMSGQRDIAFAFPADGCYARAHLMAERIQRLGVQPGKVWSFARPGAKLYVRTTNHPRGYVTWKYHVAPTVKVRRDDGDALEMVIDPAMFNGPVTVKQWRNAQKKTADSKAPYITRTRLGEPPTLLNGSKARGTGYWDGPDPREGTDAHARFVMRKYKPWEGQAPPKGLISPP